MEDLPGALGTSASLSLRFGQAIFAVASLLFMCVKVEFYSYTAYCFLITIMGLVIPWSSTLAVVDICSLCISRPARQPGVLAIAVIGDWVLSFLSLAAACSTASVTSLAALRRLQVLHEIPTLSCYGLHGMVSVIGIHPF